MNNPENKSFHNTGKVQAGGATVVIFSTAYLPFLGGAETAIKGITDKISEFDFILFTARFRRDLAKVEKVGNVMVYRLGLGNFFDKVVLPFVSFFKFLSLRKKLSGPVLFWGMMVSQGSLGAWFLKFFFPQIPFLLTVQEGDSETHIIYGRFGLIGLSWKLLLRKADRIQVISRYLKHLCLKFGASSPIEVIPNGVDLEKFSNPDIKKSIILSQKLGIQPHEKTIITVSRLTHKNAADVIIRALPLLKIPARLLILGMGEERENLTKLVSALNLQKKVIFEENLYEDLPAYLKLGQVFVRPSRSEGFGTLFLEVMADGLPFLATSVGGIRDFLIDGEAGLEARVDDPYDLARKLDLLLSDEALRQKLVQNGRRLVEEKYQWLQIAAKMRDIFSSLL